MKYLQVGYVHNQDEIGFILGLGLGSGLGFGLRLGSRVIGQHYGSG